MNQHGNAWWAAGHVLKIMTNSYNKWNMDGQIGYCTIYLYFCFQFLLKWSSAEKKQLNPWDKTFTWLLTRPVFWVITHEGKIFSSLICLKRFLWYSGTKKSWSAYSQLAINLFFSKPNLKVALQDIQAVFWSIGRIPGSRF